MKGLLLWLLLLPCALHAQTEDDFLPEVKYLVIDSSEIAAQKFSKELTGIAGGYKFAFVDRENVMLSKYMYDNSKFETLKFDFQFEIDEVLAADSTTKKNRVVKTITITGELPAMTKIYNYLLGESHTPDKIIAISTHSDKAVSYKNSSYSCRLLADDFKAGYWILSFYKL